MVNEKESRGNSVLLAARFSEPAADGLTVFPCNLLSFPVFLGGLGAGKASPEMVFVCLELLIFGYY